MGIVYKGEDTKLHRTVAIKVLPAAALSSDDDRARFYREARAAASLSHPNIAVIHEIDEAVPEGSKDDDLRPFIAMEFIEGDTLEDRIKQGPMKLEEAVRIASEIASGLEAAHKKDIVHRDIKAANVMLDGDGRAKILDFGLAKTAQSTKLTRMGSTLGTVAYMSPEQARGEEVDARTDIWALGVTLYEMIAGTHPFGGDYEQAVVYSILNEDPEPLTGVRTGVPLALEWIVTKMFAKKAGHRYQSVAEVIVDLETVDLSQAGMSRISTVSKPVSALPTRSIVKVSKRESVLIALFIVVSGAALWSAISANQTSFETTPFRKLPLIIEGLRNASMSVLSPDESFIIAWGESESGSGYHQFDFETGILSLIVEAPAVTLSPALNSDGSVMAYISERNLDSWASSLIRLPNGRPVHISDSLQVVDWWDDDTLILRSVGVQELYEGHISNNQLEDIHRLEILDIPDRAFLASIYGYAYTEEHLFYGFEFNDGSPSLIYDFDRKTRSSKLFIDGGINPLFLPPNAILYQLQEGGEVYTQGFNPDKIELEGSRRRIADPIDYTKFGRSKHGDFYLIVDPPLNTSVAIYDNSWKKISEVETSTDRLFSDLSSKENVLIGDRLPTGTSINTEIFTIDISSGREHVIDGRPGQKGTPFLSHDNNFVYYFHYQPSDSVLIRRSIDEMEQTEETQSGESAPTIFVESLTGRYVLISTRSQISRSVQSLSILDTESGQSYSIADVTGPGGNLQPTTHPIIRWSPTRDDVVMYREGADIKVFQVSTGKSFLIEPFLQNFSVDGKHVYGVTESSIVRYGVSYEPEFSLIGQPEIVFNEGTDDGIRQIWTMDSGFVLEKSDVAEFTQLWLWDNYSHDQN